MWHNGALMRPDDALIKLHLAKFMYLLVSYTYFPMA